MNTPRLLKDLQLTVCVFALFALMTDSAVGQHVLLDQPPNQTIGTGSGLAYGSDLAAENFAVIDPAGIVLNRVSWWGGSPNLLPFSDKFYFKVYRGSPGGPIVSQFNSPSLTGTPTGGTFTYGGVTHYEYLFEFDLATPLPLTPDTYWIEIAGSSFFPWAFGTTDPVYGLPCVGYLPSMFQSWVTCLLPDEGLALKLEGVSGSAPLLSVTNLVAGATATISVDNAAPFAQIRHGYSLVGGGPTATPFGNLLLTPPFAELPLMIADQNGHASLTATVPLGLQGWAIWLHALDLSTLQFFNGLNEVIG
jgi:hypothetical protein